MEHFDTIFRICMKFLSYLYILSYLGKNNVRVRRYAVLHKNTSYMVPNCS